MGYHFLLLTLAASVCARLPATNLVVPEKLDFAAHTTADSFIQAITKSGGSETDCRTFATDTISDITTGVTFEQGLLNAVDTGAGCAQEGQTLVGISCLPLAKAKADLVTKQTAAAIALSSKTTECSASVTLAVNLDTLEATKCYDYTSEGTYISADRACTLATADLVKADADVAIAQTAVIDAQTAYDAAVAAAARLKSACHCRVQHEQAAAWTETKASVAAHAADWKQSHEVLCALNQATTCPVLTCPIVTQPTLSSDVSGEDCKAPQCRELIASNEFDQKPTSVGAFKDQTYIYSSCPYSGEKALYLNWNGLIRNDSPGTIGVSLPIQVHKGRTYEASVHTKECWGRKMNVDFRVVDAAGNAVGGPINVEQSGNTWANPTISFTVSTSAAHYFQVVLHSNPGGSNDVSVDLFELFEISTSPRCSM